MHAPSLTLERVAHRLPEGRWLFPEIDLHLDAQPTGLVGRNGVGKSVLARILAGELAPTRGSCRRRGRVHYLSQQVAVAAGSTLADLAGIGATLAALARIEAGGCEPDDFARVGERWDLRGEFARTLREHGLPAWPPEHPVAALSGGEAMRGALAGAWLAEADFLILDEPSNHLDRAGRDALRERLSQWRGGLLLVSHDRALLEDMARIVELTPRGTRSTGGGHAAHAEAAAQADALAREALARCRHEARQGERERRQALERARQRQAGARRDARHANQAPILLGLAKARSEVSAGARQRRLDAAVEVQRAAVREAAAQVLPEIPVVLWPPLPASRRRVAVLEGVRLPFGPHAGHAFDLVVAPGQRIAVTGRNGSGKSTLLKVLAGRLAPAAGTCTRIGARAWLDQRLADLDGGRTALELLAAAHPGLAESERHLRLTQLGLPREALRVPAAALSGGERLKLALACAVHARALAELLLLDEPFNHLDLPSRQALETMLDGYPGALVVVCHDDMLLQRLHPTHRLDLDADAPRLAPW